MHIQCTNKMLDWIGYTKLDRIRIDMLKYFNRKGLNLFGVTELSTKRKMTLFEKEGKTCQEANVIQMILKNRL